MLLIILSIPMLQEDLGLINVCSGKPISVRQIVNDWIKINKWQIELNYFINTQIITNGILGINVKLKKF